MLIGSGAESVERLSLGRRLVDLLPVAQRINALTHGVVLDVRELQIPVVLSFIDDHTLHLSHSVVHPLNASVTVWMVGACGKLAYSQQVVDSL